MFGFTLQKALVLAVIVAAIWYGFKFIGRLDQRRKRALKAARANPAPTERNSEAGAAAKAEDTIQCPICQAYVAASGVGHCGRDDCPY